MKNRLAAQWLFPSRKCRLAINHSWSIIIIASPRRSNEATLRPPSTFCISMMYPGCVHAPRQTQMDQTQSPLYFCTKPLYTSTYQTMIDSLLCTIASPHPCRQYTVSPMWSSAIYPGCRSYYRGTTQCSCPMSATWYISSFAISVV